MNRTRSAARRRVLALGVISTAVAAGVATAATAQAAPARDRLAPGIARSGATLPPGAHAVASQRGGLPAGVPKHGAYSFLLTLAATPTATVLRQSRGKGRLAAGNAARTQLARIRGEQGSVVADLPRGSSVLYRTHTVLAGVAVRTDVTNFGALRNIAGVTAVYPIAPKQRSNAYAVPFQGASQAWQAYGDRGQNSTIAIIDTGIDYTHADFGGTGDPNDYTTAKSAPEQANPTLFPTPKVVGGYDLAGDAYDPEKGVAPKPDKNPLDCDGHGTHVAGTAAGQGVDANGAAYTGPYDSGTDFSGFRVGPGMAPEAKLYAYRVFGCAGSSSLTGAAIERAMDPDNDPATDDHVDVANLSLGSDYGSPQDGDSVLVKAATDAGITMVIASGNNGDVYDTGGSPGNAPSALTVAASRDQQTVGDALVLSAPSARYASSRSYAYDWATKADLGGSVVRLNQAGNATGCRPLSTAAKTAVKGKIVLVDWDNTTPACGSGAVGARLRAGGAKGFLLGSDTEYFDAGITGDAVIPGVLLARSGAQAIRGRLAAGQPVTVAGTEANGFVQDVAGLNDTVATFSSRGTRGANDLKPDVSAVGTTVSSAAVATGTGAATESGTSMATPMTAGLAALVRSQHQTWTPEQVKADIVNTAGHDLTTGLDGTGATYAPNRVGSGRIDAKAALDNTVLAYVSGSDVPTGVVSASFGPVAVTGETTTLTRTIAVQNTGTDSADYAVGYRARTTVPGVAYSVSPSSVIVAGGTSADVTLTLTVTRSQLAKTIDPTVSRQATLINSAGAFQLPREYVADASGLVVLTPSAAGAPSLRVPVHSSPRPASAMTQPASVTLPATGVSDTALRLTGSGVDQGSGAESVTSTVAGFGLQGTSPKLSTCAPDASGGCVHFPDEAAADLRYVGVTSSSPQLRAAGADPFDSPDGKAYFALTSWAPWTTPAGFEHAEVYIDSTGDNVADAVVVTGRLTSGPSDVDVFVAQTLDANTGEVLDTEPINDRFGDVDTALFDSDTMVLPVNVSALPGVALGKARIRYSVLTYSTASGVDPVDHVGNVDGNNVLSNPMTTDVNRPAVAVYGEYDGSASPLLYTDLPGNALTLHRDVAPYQYDRTQGVLMVHFHNSVGSKAQRVTVVPRAASATKLVMSPNPVARGKKLTATISVSSATGPTPAGTVTLTRLTGPGAPYVAGRRTLAAGKATVAIAPSLAGKFSYRVTYSGDTVHEPSTSNTVTVTVK